MKFTILTASLLCGLVQAATLNLNTGQASAGGTIQTFSDPIWTIAATPAPAGTGTGMNLSGPAFIENDYYPQSSGPNLLWQPTGLPSSSVANFISAGDCGRFGYTAACGAGTYSFTTQFIVNSLGGLSLTYQIAGDNEVALYLNGAMVGTLHGDMSTSAGWATFESGSISTGFNLGVNTLELRVINAGIYTGGMLVGDVTGDVSAAPEPATYALLSVALIGFGMLKKRQG